MKRIVSPIIGYLLLTLFISCSKSSSSDGTPPPPPPPDPGETGLVKATLNFSTGNTLVLNASGNYTYFSRVIEVVHHDTLLSITGSLPTNQGSLVVRLTNIDAPGTYPFITNQAPAPSEGYAQCEFTRSGVDEFYSTLQIRDNPGSITIQSFTSNSISGYFNAKLTNWYPDKPDAGTTITISNGSFNGNFKTTSN